MISDDDLYRLAIFLGSAAMLLIILYHFLEINAIEDTTANAKAEATTLSSKDAKANSLGR